MSDIIIDKLRIQIANPCDNWGSEETINFEACDGSLQQIQVSRNNCKSEKIIAWIKSSGHPNVGSNSSGQNIVRIINDCDTTEVRKFDSQWHFQPERPISRYGDEAPLFCDRLRNRLGLNNGFVVHGPTISGTCPSGETIYYRGEDTPLGDIDYNSRSTTTVKIGLEKTTSYNSPFVQYGTKAINMDCDILENCITGSDDIYFLYIPCGHYSSEWDGVGWIRDKAFKNLTSLRGVWIDGRSNWHIANDEDPFYNCNNLEIVYCPSQCTDYFRKFRNVKYINGTPYYWDDAEGELKAYKTYC